jgi:hypothetical protein
MTRAGAARIGGLRVGTPRIRLASAGALTARIEVVTARVERIFVFRDVAHMRGTRVGPESVGAVKIGAPSIEATKDGQKRIGAVKVRRERIRVRKAWTGRAEAAKAGAVPSRHNGWGSESRDGRGGLLMTRTMRIGATGPDKDADERRMGARLESPTVTGGDTDHAADFHLNFSLADRTRKLVTVFTLCKLTRERRNGFRSEILIQNHF